MTESGQVRLIDVQKLQFSDKEAAEEAMLVFLREHEDATIGKVELNPKPESLNSINGFITYTGGKRFFFKTHVEESEKLSEYYNAEALAGAGYPVVSAKRIDSKVGSQIALYEILSFPTLFDLTKIEEDRILKDGAAAIVGAEHSACTLIDEQILLDKRVFDIYRETLQPITAAQHSSAPVHQLFSHRLAMDGRFGLFYSNKNLAIGMASIPELPFQQLSRMRWKVNGVAYGGTLQEIVERSRRVVAPNAGASVVGHGDAHNGNVFFDENGKNGRLFFFDPAFAGRHNPLLDLVKPLFHNIFARWMYYPQEVVSEIDLSFELRDDEITIQHSFAPSEIRIQFLKSKLENLLFPLLELLRSQDLLAANWQEYMRSALFCCPFLTVNLFSPYNPEGTLSERYKLPIKLLGLATAVQFGSSEHEGADRLSELIDSIFRVP